MKTDMEHWWNGSGRGKLKYWEEDLSSVTAYITNPTPNELRSNPEFRSKRPATDGRSHGTAFEDLNTSKLYIKIQSVPVIKKSVTVVWRNSCCFVLRSAQNTQIHCVGRNVEFIMLQQAPLDFHWSIQNDN